MQITRLEVPQCSVGEGPVWDSWPVLVARRQTFLSADSIRKLIYVYDYDIEHSQQSSALLS